MMIGAELHAYWVPPQLVSRGQRRNPGSQQTGTSPIDPDLALAASRQVHCQGDDDQGEHAQRQVDVERPPPAQVVGEEAAEQRTADERHRHHRGHQPLVAAALPQRHQISDDRHGAHHQTTGAQALQPAEPDQLAHVLGHTSQRGPGQEQHDRGHEHALATVEITELGPHRCGHRGSQRVGSDHPREVGQTTQLADDGRHCGAYHEVVQYREQHGDQQTAHHGVDLPLGPWLDHG
jgi:hypothetical protein